MTIKTLDSKVCRIQTYEYEPRAPKLSSWTRRNVCFYVAFTLCYVYIK